MGGSARSCNGSPATRLCVGGNFESSLAPAPSVLLAFINLFSLRKLAGRFQVAVTLCKVGVIAVIICTGLYYMVFRGGRTLG